MPMILVTGLPRSGTSLLMQMLEAGGVPVFVDAAGREPHARNERGHYEHAATSRDDADWLPAARGRAVKVVADRLCTLTPDLSCPILVARRSLAEVAESTGIPVEHHEEERAAMDAWLSGRDHLPVYHRSLMLDQASTLESIRNYLGLPLDLAAMAAAVNPSLWHHRAD